MSSDHLHIIQRQVLELTVPSDTDAYELQERMRKVYSDRALSMLDRLFSRAVDSDKIVRVDRLEVDLGVLPADRLEERFLVLLRREVEELLAQSFQLSGSRRGADSTALRSTTAGERKLETLLVFLGTGQLPWWSADTAAYDPEVQLVELIEEQPAALRFGLQTKNTRVVSRRLACQFTPDSLKRLVQVLVPAEAAELLSTVEQIQGFLSDRLVFPGRSFDTPAVVWEPVFEELLRDPAAAHRSRGRVFGVLEHMLEVAARTAGISPPEVYDQIRTAIGKTIPESSVIADWIDVFGTSESSPVQSGADAGATRGVGDEENSAPGRRSPSDNSAGETQDRETAQTATDGNAGTPDAEGLEQAESPRAVEDNRSFSSDHPRDEKGVEFEERADARADVPVGQQSVRDEPTRRERSRPARRPEDEPEAILEDGDRWADYYIDNAGLVLLWPYLGHFFASLDMVDEGAFLSEELQARAVLLTQFVVTGDSDGREHLLLLNKILCGWPVAEPVNRSFQPSDRESAETEELLTSVIAHWEVLGTTSVDGLRGSFLLREGKLSRGETQWELTIERTGYDVLLDRLPWGLAHIRHPWMNKPVTVEW